MLILIILKQVLTPSPAHFHTRLFLAKPYPLTRFDVPFWLSNILVYLFYFFSIESVPVETEV